jgi:hypothetical protein
MIDTLSGLPKRILRGQPTVNVANHYLPPTAIGIGNPKPAVFIFAAAQSLCSVHRLVSFVERRKSATLFAAFGWPGGPACFATLPNRGLPALFVAFRRYEKRVM